MRSYETLNNKVQNISVPDSYKVSVQPSISNKQSKRPGFMLNTAGYITFTLTAAVIALSSGCAVVSESRKCENDAKERAFWESGMTLGSERWFSALNLTRSAVHAARLKDAYKTYEQEKEYYRLVEKYIEECKE